MTLQQNRSIDYAAEAGTAQWRRVEQERVRRVLLGRLSTKIANLEREASRLNLRGQRDAAQVLSREARKLRALTRQA